MTEPGHEVVPVLDFWGSPREHNRRCVGRAVLRQPLLPGRVDEATRGDRVDVVGERQARSAARPSITDRACAPEPP
jgi:hypothetical protein